MTTMAGELLNIMTARKAMHEEGLTHPHPSVVVATRQLVSALGTLPADDRIEIAYDTNPLCARYVRSRTGEVLAQIRTDVGFAEPGAGDSR